MINNFLQLATDNKFRLTSIGWFDDGDGDDGYDRNYMKLMRRTMILFHDDKRS